MTALQKKLLAALEKTMSRARKDFERDSALFASFGQRGLHLLAQRHKGIVELCEKEIAKLKG